MTRAEIILVLFCFALLIVLAFVVRPLDRGDSYVPTDPVQVVQRHG